MNKNTEPNLLDQLAINHTIAVLKEKYDTCEEYVYGCQGCEATRVVAFLEEVIKEL